MADRSLIPRQALKQDQRVEQKQAQRVVIDIREDQAIRSEVELDPGEDLIPDIVEEEREDESFDEDNMRNANADSDEPYEPEEVEWSPWCEDSDAPFLWEYVSERFRVKEVGEELGLALLSRDDEKIRRIALSEELPKAVRRQLLRLIDEYDFYYGRRELKASETVRPDVIIVKNDSGSFDVIIPDYYMDLPSNIRRSRVKARSGILREFVEHLISKEPVRRFLEAEDLSEGKRILKQKVKERKLRWSQKAFADELNIPRSRVSQIVNKVTVEIPSGEIILFREFFS